jgi:hypothetical protein
MTDSYLVIYERGDDGTVSMRPNCSPERWFPRVAITKKHAA